MIRDTTYVPLITIRNKKIYNKQEEMIMNKNNVFTTKQVFEHALEYISTRYDCNRFDIKTTDVDYIEKLLTDLTTLRVHYGVEGFIYHGTSGRGLVRGDSRTAKYTKICEVNGSPLWRYEGWCDTDDDDEYFNLTIFDEQYHLEVVVETTTAKYTMRFDRVSSRDSYCSIDDVVDELNRDIADLDYDDDEGYRRYRSLTKDIDALSEATNLKQVLAIITPEEKDDGFNEVIKTISGFRNSINEININIYGTMTRIHVDHNGCIIYPILSVFSDEQIQPIYIEYEDGTYSVSREEEKVNA